MTKTLEKIVKFRVDAHLYNAMVEFAHAHGYNNLSQLIRGVLIMNFMGIMLGQKKSLTREQLHKELQKQINEFYKKSSRRK